MPVPGGLIGILEGPQKDPSSLENVRCFFKFLQGLYPDGPYFTLGISVLWKFLSVAFVKCSVVCHLLLVSLAMPNSE